MVRLRGGRALKRLLVLAVLLLLAGAAHAKVFFGQHGSQGPFTPPPPTLAISVNPTAVTDPDTTPPGTNLSFITVTVSDGSTFHGTVAFGGTNGDGGGVCVLVPASTTLAAPTTNTLVDSDGTWSFGTTSGTGGYPLLLNGTQAAGGVGVLFVSFNGFTYVENSVGTGQWFQWNGSSYASIAGDPRRSGSAALALAKVLTAGTYNCGIVATQ
jgi:hypothetical protein